MVVDSHKQQSPKWHLINANLASISGGVDFDFELRSYEHRFYSISRRCGYLACAKMASNSY